MLTVRSQPLLLASPGHNGRLWSPIGPRKLVNFLVTDGESNQPGMGFAGLGIAELRFKTGKGGRGAGRILDRQWPLAAC